MPYRISWRTLRMVARLAVCLTLWDVAWAQGAAKSGEGPELQNAVMHAMAGRRGTAVVLDVGSGRVLASYEPEVAARRLVYPGSAIKPFTLLALLESGKVDEHTVLMCKRPLTIGGHNFDCTHPILQQPFDPSTALAYSCNSYFTDVATRLTPGELRNGFLKFGFGTITGLMPKEATGSIALPGSQEQLQLEAIGEWGIRVTPIELLHGYQKLARLSETHEPALASLFTGLEGSTDYGMGRLAQPESAMKIAGKTGTSLADEGPWHHGWFAGYAPTGKPEIALVVFLEKGNGPTDAAGIAREIFGAYANLRSTSSRNSNTATPR